MSHWLWCLWWTELPWESQPEWEQTCSCFTWDIEPPLLPGDLVSLSQLDHHHWLWYIWWSWLSQEFELELQQNYQLFWCFCWTQLLGNTEPCCEQAGTSHTWNLQATVVTKTFGSQLQTDYRHKPWHLHWPHLPGESDPVQQQTQSSDT